MATDLFKSNPSNQDNTEYFQCNNNGEYFLSPQNNDITKISTTNNSKLHKKRREKLGGNNNLVVVDSFPDGYRKFNENICVNIEDRLILAFAEITETPTKYRFKSLPNSSENCRNSILETIRQSVLPDSTLIIDDSFIDIVENLNFSFNTVVTINMLERHNSVNQNVVENLKLIWQKAVSTCDNVHDIREVEFLLESICN